MENGNKLTAWVIEKIKTEYPDDVALLVAVEGASINGDGHGEPFDYFVPATERGNQLAQTFIIGDLGNDLYPRSWERTEATANLEDLTTPCLGNARILYARSKQDEERFEALRQKLYANLADPAFTYKKALENLEMAMDLYRTMLFEERLYRVRALAGFVYHYLTVSVACLNKTYRKEWHNGAIGEISSWEKLPANFVEYYKAILQAGTAAELKSLSHLLIASARQFIAGFKPQAVKPEKRPDWHWLAEWYQELRTWWNRLYYFCGVEDSDAAFREACQLQSELDIVGEEFGLGELDLLGVFSPAGLEALAQRAAQLEKTIVAAAEGAGIQIRRYATLEAFLAANGQ